MEIAYKTKSNIFDHVVAQALVAGFTSQLKDQWDHYLDKFVRNKILYAIMKNEGETIIKDEIGVEI